MPREVSPCGTVLDRDCAMLMKRPHLHYPLPPEAEPAIQEVLLVPFHVGGKAVGTVWVISHDESCRFDLEDLRLLTALAEYASRAYIENSMDELQAILAARLASRKGS